jgi:hypothetical protein
MFPYMQQLGSRLHIPEIVLNETLLDERAMAWVHKL